MKIETVKLSKLKAWEDNPRGVKKDDYKRLEAQVKDLKVYKPLLVNQDYIVLGGNMRLKVFADMGFEDVVVSVVEAKTKEMMIKYALSDNDRIGYYEDDTLAELVASVPDIDLGNYKVDLGKPISIDKLLEQFGPNGKEKKIEEITCPECGAKFSK